MKESIMKTNFRLAKRFKIRRAALNILFSLIVFSLFILALEIVLRTTHLFGARISPSEPDPILGWRFSPGRKYWHNKETDHPIVGRINSHGWRDKEWSVRKAHDTYRIAVLGDSMVEALQVESDRTFLALTEHQLNEIYNIKAELMNFGLSGATQTEELLILKNDVDQFSPDMVLLFFLPGNDIRDVSQETALETHRPFYSISENGGLILDTSFSQKREFRIRCYVNYFKKHSALISLLCERYLAYRKCRAERMSKGSDAGISPKKLGRALSLCTDTPDQRYLRSYRLNKILIKAMSDYCREKKIKFMIVCIETSACIPENEKKYTTIDPTFDPNFFEDDLKNFAELLGVEYLGLQRIFRQYYKSDGVLPYWGHWNYDGHKVVANALANKVESILNRDGNEADN